MILYNIIMVLCRPHVQVCYILYWLALYYIATLTMLNVYYLNLITKREYLYKVMNCTNSCYTYICGWTLSFLPFQMLLLLHKCLVYAVYYQPPNELYV